MAIDDEKFLYLCSWGTFEEVISALNEGANPNAKDIECKTALMRAAHYNVDSRIITALLDAGANIRARSTYRMTALDWADNWILDKEKTEDIRRVLKSAMLSMNPIDDDIFTILCRCADSEEVRAALKKGASPNAQDIYSTSVLMWASCYGGKLWLAELMLSEGADPDLRDDRGRTALMFAAECCESPAMISALIDAGADVNAKDNDGATALMISAMYNTPGMMTAILDSGAEINARDNQRRPALFYAIRNENTESAKILVQSLSKAGKNLRTIRDSEGKTALMYAAEKCADPELIRTLIEAGSDVNAHDNHGTTALMYAAAKNVRPEILYALINSGADLNAQNEGGNTALILAAMNRLYLAILGGRLKIKPQNLKILIEAGADPYITNNGGLTFSDYLIRKS